ncbi:MAG: hypothetical protein NC200_07975 [Candidatus Gastranaerophilales bacterium]|nr:hypothetical protein [Candidatus Gastranaerophilales bacterium]
MKSLGILVFILAFGSSVLASQEVSLGEVQKDTYKLTPPKQKVSGSLLINDTRVLDELIKLQKEKDLADIEILWKGTIENNKVIEFALKKLATPESQRRIHSSLMAKTLSAIVSGASLVPSVVGCDYAIQSSAYSAGRLAQSLLNRKNIPQETPLTDTELIELAGLIEDLQDTIISTYYNYKNSLIMIKDTRERILLYAKNYDKAQKNGDILDLTISSTLYDNMIIQEFEEVQNAKKYHAELQRLAGKTAVDKLNLYQFDFNSALFKDKLK